MYKQIYENAIAQIEANRARDIEVAKQKATQEQIVPFNRDIDISLRDAIAEAQSEHNAKIAQLQQAFEAKKNALAEAAAQKKATNAEIVIASAVSVINTEADDAIKNLREYIDKGA